MRVPRMSQSQIKVRDFSNTAVTELMAEAKGGLKARVEAELAVAASDSDMQSLRDKFAAEERAIEHDIDHNVHSFSTSLDITYNFLSN